MPFSNYGELKTSIAGWLNRTDLEPIIPDFIALAEAVFRRDIRHWMMEDRSTAPLTGRYLERPQGWLETIRVTLATGNTTSLDLISRQAMADKREESMNATGTPQFYTHVENSFEYCPSPDGEYTVQLHYFKEVTRLAADADSNWLLTDHPDAYLYGSLLHAGPYLIEDERVATWSQLFGAAVARINGSSEKSIHSGSGLVMRNRGLG
jgi:hypothetical protein